MKIRHIALVAAVFMFASGSASAINTWTNSNTNTNTNNDITNARSFGINSFTLTTSNMNISQTGANASSPGTFCQFFSYTFGMTQIIQIIQGTSFSQVFASASDPVDDPCL